MILRFILFLSLGYLTIENCLAQDLDWIDQGMENNPKATLDSIHFLIADSKKSSFQKALLLDKLTSIYFFDLKDYRSAFHTVNKIKNEFNRSGDKRIKIIQLENLGMLYYESKLNKEKAFTLFNEAYSESLKEGTNFHAEFILNNHGVSLQNSGKFEEASKKYHEALYFARRAKDNAQTSTILCNLGIYHLILKNKDSAVFYLKRSFDFAKKSNSTEDELERAIYLGAFYRDLGNYQVADSFLTFANAHITALKKFDSKKFLSELLSQVSEKQGNLYEALKFSKLASVYRDSIDFSNLSKQLLSSENRIKIVKLENAIQRSKERNWYNLVMGFLVLLIITTLGIILVSRNRHRAVIAEMKARKNLEERDKLSEELELTDRDITMKSMVLLEKENLMNKVNRLLKETAIKLKKEDQSLIEEVISEINFSLNNKSWNEFELRFNKVHPNFYKKLDETHHGLTLNEKKLAAFLIMNMTSKDISNITGQTAHSINVARTRLRKKMGLANSNVSFSEYLTQFI
jgi:tetratricopeptide (TPR) repeat protein